MAEWEDKVLADKARFGHILHPEPSHVAAPMAVVVRLHAMSKSPARFHRAFHLRSLSFLKYVGECAVCRFELPHVVTQVPVKRQRSQCPRPDWMQLGPALTLLQLVPHVCCTSLAVSMLHTL